MNERTIIVLINILILLVGFSIITTNSIKTDLKRYKISVDSIQIKIDSISLLNKELDNRLVKLDTNISIITREIESVDNNINVIKKKTNEKVNTVDNYDNDELNKFFTIRYGN